MDAASLLPAKVNGCQTPELKKW